MPFLVPRSRNAGGFLCAARALWVLRVRLARGCERAARRLAGRPPGCGAGSDAGDPRLSGPQPGVRGQGPPRALQKSRARARQHREQAQRYRAALCLAAARGGNAGYLLWQDDQLPALIDWDDPVVKYGLAHPIKYARLIRRQASSPRAAGADRQGDRYFVQLALEGVPYQKPKHPVGTDTIGLDLGPSTIAIVPREGEASLEQFCEELAPDARGHPPPAAQDGSATASSQSRQLRRKGRIKKRAASKKLAGNRARATRPPGGAKRPKSAGWPPIARACMGA